MLLRLLHRQLIRNNNNLLLTKPLSTLSTTTTTNPFSSSNYILSPKSPTTTQPQRLLTQTHPFSTTTSSDLSVILARELEDESDTTTLPPQLQELKTELEDEWRIVDSPPGSSSSTSSTAIVKMHRKTNGPFGSKIQIGFHCQDTMEEEGEQMIKIPGMNEEEEEKDDDEEESAVPVRFRVSVTRAGKSMVFGCLSEEGVATVESLVVREGEGEELGKEDETLYQGPEFTELAEDLQESLTLFLQEDCGIDGDVATFITMYSDYKEQQEYVNWLKNLQNMLQ